MKTRLKGLFMLLVLTVLLIPSVKASAAVQPAVPTGLGFYGQNSKNNDFILSWNYDQNIMSYGANRYFGYQVVVTTTKGKRIATFDKNVINNISDMAKKDNKFYLYVKNSKMLKQAFKYKVRAYVYDEAGNKIYSKYSSTKVIVPRATISNFKAISTSSGKISWKKISGAKNYTVYVSTDGGKKYKKKGTTKATSYTIKGMELNKDYRVYIVANGIKIGKKNYNSTKPKWKSSNAADVYIYITY